MTIFNNKKKYKIDKSGKTLAIFLKDQFSIIDEKIINHLIMFSKKKNLQDIRICMHSNRKSKIHNMINLINKKKKNIYHKHISKDEIYHIIKGEMKIEYLKKGKKRKITLNKKKNIFRMKKNTYHQIVPLTKYVVFHEIRQGPFFKTDSVFK